MDLTALSEVLKQSGPWGLCMLLMGSGLIYLTRWLREERKQTDIAHEAIRAQFLAAIKDQRTEHTQSLREVTSDFKDSLAEQGKRIDGLAQKVEGLDEHVQELRMR